MMGLRERSNQFEIMDDMTMAGPELRRTLDLLASINLWLGGNALTLDGMKSLLTQEGITLRKIETQTPRVISNITQVPWRRSSL